jgi:PRD1 phage membrane DNA delivery
MKFADSIVTVLLAIIGVAIIAVLVSKQANTGSVLGAGGSALANAISCAASPVIGAGCGTSVSSSISFG